MRAYVECKGSRTCYIVESVSADLFPGSLPRNCLELARGISKSLTDLVCQLKYGNSRQHCIESSSGPQTQRRHSDRGMRSLYPNRERIVAMSLPRPLWSEHTASNARVRLSCKPSHFLLSHINFRKDRRHHLLVFGGGIGIHIRNSVEAAFGSASRICLEGNKATAPRWSWVTTI